MKAIETEYKGYKFRSRLEARWAVFFDSLNIRWDYEPEGYNLDGFHYLPDFHLPNFHNPENGLYVEVKPINVWPVETQFHNPPQTNFIKKIETFYDFISTPIFLATGVPDLRFYPLIDFIGWTDAAPEIADAEGEYRCWTSSGNDQCSYFDKSWDTKNKYSKAVKNAKQARFEHGEKPNI